MFPLRDPEQSTVPFAVYCRASAGGPSADAASMPGRIFIEYEYEFRNAIGASTVGFQPSTVKQITITTGGDVTGDQVAGILVDAKSPTAGESKSFSSQLPFNARITWDIAATGETYFKVNGNRYSGDTVIAYVYSDDGKP